MQINVKLFLTKLTYLLKFNSPNKNLKIVIYG